MNDKQKVSQQIAWVKAFNKQGVNSGTKYYINDNQENMSDEETMWFVEFSYHFLYSLQNVPLPNSEKVVFCQGCLEFYQGWKELVENKLK